MIDDRLNHHLTNWLGAWPGTPGLTVVGSNRRVEPGWDGHVRPLVGVASPSSIVISVPPSSVDEVRSAGATLQVVGPQLPQILGHPDKVFGIGVFRWSDDPPDLGSPGTWVPTSDERLPEWLQPFNGDVLVGVDDHGAITAGVGRKQHDRFGHELAVVTEEGFRGRGWASRLVAQAARRVLDDGAVPTYLHDPENTASARTADAAGFPDRGWRIVGLW